MRDLEDYDEEKNPLEQYRNLKFINRKLENKFRSFLGATEEIPINGCKEDIEDITEEYQETLEEAKNMLEEENYQTLLTESILALEEELAILKARILLAQKLEELDLTNTLANSLFCDTRDLDLLCDLYTFITTFSKQEILLYFNYILAIQVEENLYEEEAMSLINFFSLQRKCVFSDCTQIVYTQLSELYKDGGLDIINMILEEYTQDRIELPFDEMCEEYVKEVIEFIENVPFFESKTKENLEGLISSVLIWQRDYRDMENSKIIRISYTK